MRVQSCLALLLAASATPAVAQMIPDGTLPVNSTVAGGCTICMIDGGTVRGTNLFHSFSQFSVPTGGQALFNNGVGVQNILTRVTGLSPSNIDGLIQTKGTANLFLLNPHGILFGSNASLNVGGSFLATTANHFKFADGSEFGSTQSPSPPLLTVTAPVGLGFLGNSGPIQVQGLPHIQRIVSIQNAFVAAIYPTGAGETQTGLQVQPGQTLALVGNSVEMQGGTITAPSGQIELGSVALGTVGLVPNAAGFSLSYVPNTLYSSITLAKQAALDASGTQFSNIHLQGQDITFTDASVAVIENDGFGAVGQIRLDAAGQINLIGLTDFNRQDLLPPTEKIQRAIASYTFDGPGPDIELNAPVINLTDSVYVLSSSFGPGRSGDVRVNTSQLDIRRIEPQEISRLPSSIGVLVYGSGEGGNITVSADQVHLSESGQITTRSFGTGNSGDITVKADSVVVEGGTNTLLVTLDPYPQAFLSFAPTSIISQSLGSSDSGSVNIDARQLRALNGATVGTLASGLGGAGLVTLAATDLVEVRGKSVPKVDFEQQLSRRSRLILQFLGISGSRDLPIELEPAVASSISSSSGSNNLYLAAVSNITQTANGVAGGLNIQTAQLQVQDGVLAVLNQGIGNAGMLRVDASKVNLMNGSITATTAQGIGGVVAFNLDQGLVAQNSQITASAGGAGFEGGNILISAPVIALLRGTTLSANAEGGRGGQVSVTAQGLFRSLDTQVTATSALGPQFDGRIQFNAPEVDLTRNTFPLLAVTNPPPISSICGTSSAQQSSFTETGTGGLPQNPAQKLSVQEGWQENPLPSLAKVQQQPNPPSIVEAQGLIRNEDGTLQLVADTGQGSRVPSLSSSSCLPQSSQPRAAKLP